jgi:gamma-glutamyltranspeptidase/glutathione hydrolase
VIRAGAVALGRAPIAGRQGAVAAGHQVAAQVGVDALRQGGSVVDAVIAAAFASFVVEPQMCGIGGHGRMSVWMAGQAQATGIDHFIRAPAAATPDMYQRALARQGNLAGRIETTGHLAVGIPGAIAGLEAAHRRFGKRAWHTLVGPAIELARAGLVVEGPLAAAIAARAAEIRRFPAAASMLLPDGLPPRPTQPGRPGHRFDFGAMAATLQVIAAEGAAAFHDGPLAAAIAREMESGGGLLGAADLAAYRPATFAQPTHSYRRWRYVTCGDLILVECLNILERFDLSALECGSAAECHLIAEALAQAFLDNFAHAADPLHGPSPLAGLASKEFAAEMAARIDRGRAQAAMSSGDPWAQQRAFAGTTQLCAMDAAGNAASLITSLGSAFGSLVLVPETGVFLGNAMQWFDPLPGRANSVGPGRMPLYAAPVLIVADDGGPIGALAASGGYRIQTAVLHALLHRLEHGLDPQAAIDAPRLHTEGAGLELDARIDQAAVDGLRALGHRPALVDGAGWGNPFGRPSSVWRTAAGDLVPASDARAGGVAALD